MQSTVGRMIERLEELHASNSWVLDSVHSYSDLVDALEELDRMVEMKEAKASIVLQLEYILIRLANKIQPESIFDGQMLHSVISGPPGTGKTQLGKLMAKIWHALGILKAPLVEVEETASEVYTKAKWVTETTNQSLVKMARDLTSMAQDMVIRGPRIHDRIVAHLNRLQDETIDLIRNNQLETPTPIKRHQPIFKVVSRVDFVAGYRGQTAIKTMKLLMSALGGVLFIDEAYSLINDDQDSFGMEALTTLNQFMSEHPHEIIVIFGGYTDLMNETIFRQQPGLKRRCSWYYEISGYSGDGLASIFQLQLRKYDWQVAPTVDLVEFFTRHIAHFTNYGGDTEKFAFYCKLYHMDAEFEKISQDSLKRRPNVTEVITGETLEVALAKYKANRVECSIKESKIPFGLYM